MTEPRKPSAAARIATLVLAIGVAGWVFYDRIAARSPAPVVEAVRNSDPAIGDAPIEMTNTGHFLDADGYQRSRLRLWCGGVEGRPGTVAVVASRGRRNSPPVVRELALSWSDSLTGRQQWLISECRRLSP
ncbi:hypothetical protein [Brevundimonas sp.]|uniref:hypothetical protein n=1 Tax=Brevundimonas sp. TaxID=1871086 RepID=UPI002D6C7F33|nr:hypothetical protein [Brevundimonas sp.]HYD27542.1 hypothetical protein [Brevundimonas sp.]